MNYRRILYIAFMVFVVLYLFQILEIDGTVDEQVQVLTAEHFLDLIRADSELSLESSTIYFPMDYKGEAGEVFYVSVDNSDGPITYKYRLEQVENDGVEELQFKREQTWEGIKIPANKFDAYVIIDGRWVKI